MTQNTGKPSPCARDLRIEYVATSALTRDPSNARKHSKKQIERLPAGIREFGFTNPILVDERRNIIAGHARLDAAALIPLVEVPCVELAGLSAEQRKALAVADNKLGDMSSFDVEVLTATLARRSVLGPFKPLIAPERTTGLRKRRNGAEWRLVGHRARCTRPVYARNACR